MTPPHQPAADFPRERTAIVTGAASARGIGQAIAHRLAAEGWSIAILDLDEDASQEVAARIQDTHGVACLGVGVDISDRNAVLSAVENVSRSLPQLVGLVNNAGVSSPVPFLEVTEDEWRRVIAVNLHGTFHVTQAAAKIMAAKGIGRIVNISSTSAERGGGVYGLAAYSASKAALLGFARTLARELGPYGVTANSVAPGSIDTDIMGGPLSDERKAVLLRELPVGRIGTVRDVAAVVSFLLSEDAGYLTGVTYDVNGGSHIA
ncbi:SDR family NAD(P)-dependent oxidoreductase [Saccharopolyspora phatthalungensis]|uniref:2-hydroxycyclohexanecarboxyl-CoA dehydrogenase n=1 Tax=Saccharopolyspora phatthalungensis TaxID=664693 RepID=A0A840Q998_9PSEU|nr:SDR family NAD(P)-dependent oxidoreductase [Saccharopolyspora phatthalungensis]MBB5159122.1 2-hydroxycyclohexanecarboxyl-CoA dehydrogenase [Saccharopolyspora phatthalungensis]